MSNSHQLRERLPHDFISIEFTSWATIRDYSTETELGCLTVVRHSTEDLRETVAVEPTATLLASLARMLDEPTLRMLTIITTADDPDTVYKSLAKDHGVTFIGNGGKIMATDLARPSDGTTPEDQLAAIDPAFMTQIEEKPDSCISVKIMLGDRVVSSGQATVTDSIATFDGIFTEMDFQRRGLATAVMGYLVRWVLSRGASFGLLNASPFGQMLYQGLGWTALYNVVHIGSQLTVEFQDRMRKKYTS